jgi:hypothetical protein
MPAITTTYHHPFYDVTQEKFVEAMDLRVGDHLQTADGGDATVEEVRPYHSTEVTYDRRVAYVLRVGRRCPGPGPQLRWHLERDAEA